MPRSTRRIDTRNDEFQLVQALLRNRKQRTRQGRFVVEGVRSIEQLRATGWPVDAYCYSDTRPLSRWARDVLDQSQADRHLALTDELLAELSDKEETSELLAVARIPSTDLGDIPVRNPALVVLLDRPQSPGNLGTLIRSCDAFGVDGIAIDGHAADPFDPRAVRAAAGSLFSVPLALASSTRRLEEWIDSRRREPGGICVVGSSAEADTPLSAYRFPRSILLAIGNERSGLSHAWTERCDAVVAIPMRGAASSLNVGAAASVLLYEVARQRSADAP